MRNPPPPHEPSVVVDLRGRLPVDAPVESLPVVGPPEEPGLPPEVGQGAEPDLGDQLQGEDLVEPLKLPPPAVGARPGPRGTESALGARWRGGGAWPRRRPPGGCPEGKAPQPLRRGPG